MARFVIPRPLRNLGPGLVVAAAGIGAGDVITATVTGATFGTRLAWAMVACVALKFALNEGVARWQLATGSTIVEACACRLPRCVAVCFLVYLLLWTFFVGGSLANACGLAGHALCPAWPVWAWGMTHSAAAAAFVALGGFASFERVMKILVGVMVVAVLICALLLRPDAPELACHLVWPELPPGAGVSVLGILGGIGGTVTMLCYGYWIRENGWDGIGYRRVVRTDLLFAYGVTLVFAVALSVVAAGCHVEVVRGAKMALAVATRLEALLGSAGRWTFLIGFWCAVFGAMLAVWQGVPYLFADLMTRRARGTGPVRGAELRRGRTYRVCLLFLAGPPMTLLFTVIGSFFMPFLAATLLYLNNRCEWMGALRNGAVRNAALLVALLLFGWIAIAELCGIFTP